MVHCLLGRWDLSRWTMHGHRGQHPQTSIQDIRDHSLDLNELAESQLLNPHLIQLVSTSLLDSSQDPPAGNREGGRFRRNSAGEVNSNLRKRTASHSPPDLFSPVEPNEEEIRHLLSDAYLQEARFSITAPELLLPSQPGDLTKPTNIRHRGNSRNSP